MDKALLIGINKYPSSPLKGCVNDVKDMADLLTEKCGFDMNDIRLLTDERADKNGIIERLEWLVSGIRSGDRLFFHYSGHGVQLPTRNPQGEVDNLDECICPVDFDWTEEHVIRDKDFNRLFSSVPSGVQFTWISDSCHSYDLSKLFLMPDTRVRTIIPPADIEWRIETAKMKNIKISGSKDMVNSLNLVLLSGCESDKTSADARFKDKYNGAFTYSLLKQLHSAGGLDIALPELLDRTRKELHANRFEQIPQIEGNEDLISRPFFK